jgi:hypothetical protein
VDWYPTLMPKHSLGNAKELVCKFEVRLRVQRESQCGKGMEARAIVLEDGERLSEDEKRR